MHLELNNLQWLTCHKTKPNPNLLLDDYTWVLLPYKPDVQLAVGYFYQFSLEHKYIDVQLAGAVKYTDWISIEE